MVQPLKILIVEDETITALDLRQTLETAGYIVTAIADDYQTAVRAVKQNPPDLALIDINLADSTANGVVTAKELVRQHQMPIIYLTANSQPATFQAAKETLPAAYLLKPFRHDELTLQIELAYHFFQSKQAGTTDLGCLYWPVNGGHEQVDIEQVLYLEADGAYASAVVLGVEKPYHISTNLKHLAQYFPEPVFFRLSRSLIINLKYLKRIEQNHLYLGDYKLPVPIPTASRKELLKRLTVVRTK